VRTVYVESASEVEHEYYLGIVLDRAEEKLAIIASTEGGMEIEEVAAKTPEKIITVSVDNATGLTGYAVRQIGFGLGLDAAQVKQLDVFLSGLYRLFVEKDASLATRSSTSTIPASTDTPRSWPCATRRRRIPGSARPGRSISPTWGSTATSAAW
jgi:hypothetical protein